MKTLKHIFVCTAAVLATASCNEQKEPMTPEAVVETFCRAVAAGDFDAARSLCDTVSMDDYLKNYQTAMNSLQKEDSCATAIAASMLSGAEFEVDGIEKNGDERIIRYTLAAEGNIKKKKATVAKEEGEWRVKEITDVI